MTEPEDQTQNNSEEEFVCSDCGKEVKEDFEFCPHCGAILSENVFCDKHRRVKASAVCIICAIPCCDECGDMVDHLFLCNHHADYEIYEGMVKVYGTHDEPDAEITKSRLDEAGLHPVLFHLRRSKDRGHVEYEVYEDSEGYNSSEIRVMVPCQEVEQSESILETPLKP